MKQNIVFNNIASNYQCFNNTNFQKMFKNKFYTNSENLNQKRFAV